MGYSVDFPPGPVVLIHWPLDHREFVTISVVKPGGIVVMVDVGNSSIIVDDDGSGGRSTVGSVTDGGRLNIDVDEGSLKLEGDVPGGIGMMIPVTPLVDVVGMFKLGFEAPLDWKSGTIWVDEPVEL
jgi:hypothetical protein